jgi:hypothetical protein
MKGSRMNFRQTIRAIQKRIEENNSSRESNMRILGERLLRIEPSKINKSPLKNVYVRAEEVISGAKNSEMTDAEVNQTLQLLGKAALTLDIELVKSFEDRETLKIIGKLTELEREKTELEGQLRRLEAALEIHQIEERISASEAHMRHLKAVVERKSSQIKGLSRMIAEMENQRDKLLRIRGSEDTLLESLSAERPKRNNPS